MISPLQYQPLPATLLSFTQRGFDQHGKASPKVAVRSLHTSSQVKQLLLIEDDEDDQLLFREAIEDLRLPVQLQVAGHGVQAIELLRDNTYFPDLIIMDMNMPAMNGMDCLKRLKKDARLQSIPVVIFTTSQNPADAEKAMALGASFFSVKPPSFTLLKNTITGFLKVHS